MLSGQWLGAGRVCGGGMMDEWSGGFGFYYEFLLRVLFVFLFSFFECETFSLM